jgi:hypothetical protein
VKRYPQRLALALLAGLALGAPSCPRESGSPAPPTAASPSPPPVTDPPPAALPSIAIRPTGAPGLAEAVRAGDFFRWVVPNVEGLRVEVGPQAAGEIVVVADLLPAAAATRELLAGLPVGLDGDTVTLAGRSYAGRALAARRPDGSTWVVVAPTPEAAAGLVDELLFRVVGRGRRGAGPPPDYLVRESRYLERSGRWSIGSDGTVTVDAATARDDLAARDHAFAALVRLGGRRVTLLVPADATGRPELPTGVPADASGPELQTLAADLDRAVAEMAARLPLGDVERRPVTVTVEPDHVAQARHNGQIGEAVPGARSDLALVFHPDDLGAYRHALARVLLARAGIRGLPPWLERGAALWLSGSWYGRPYGEWIPLLAAADVLPTAEQLLAREEQDDSSALLWTPAAAALVARLPGATVAEKLARVPDAAALTAGLAALAETSHLSQQPPPPTRRLAAPGGFLRGVSLAMLNSLDGGYHAPGLADRLAVLRGLGADAVSLMPFAYQPVPDRPGLSLMNRSPESETDIGVLHATRLARAAGLRVMSKPHIWVSHDSWPGEIAMTNEQDWARWWASYRRYVLHHALLARWAGADLYCVGVELSRTSGRPEWRRLIADVRLFYPGPVTYAANWGADLDDVRFWDALDLAGVDAYDPLAASPEAAPEELAAGARRLVDLLAALARRTGKPVLLTEVGYAARKAAWTAPHEEGGEPSEADQATSYRALFRVLGRPSWLAGTFVWKAFSGETGGRGRAADFRFQGRPAEAAIREYYQADALAR